MSELEDVILNEASYTHTQNRLLGVTYICTLNTISREIIGGYFTKAIQQDRRRAWIK